MRLEDQRRRTRRISLTPMIDVVFLLLVFFMLASRFGVEAAIPLPLAGGGGTWSGPPRLVDIRPEGRIALNGEPVALDALAPALEALSDGPQDPVVLRGRDGATLQDVANVAQALSAAGRSQLVLTE